MEKDAVYSMRMSTSVREALNRVAKKECRTVASLLNKIITDYLRKEGFLLRSELVEERRRFPRKKMNLPITTIIDKELKAEAFPGVALDISMGGVLVAYTKGTGIRFTSKGALPHFTIWLYFPKGLKPLCFDCIVRHMRDVGNEIQVGAGFVNPSKSDLKKLPPYLI